MPKVNALIAAAGRGSRAGLPYPKTLFPIQGTPILLRIAALVAPYDPNPTVIVSATGEAPIRQRLSDAGIVAHIVRQPEPRGMGDAVLLFERSPAFESSDHVLLIWGDIPFIQPTTVAAIFNAHFENNNDFTFATRLVDSAYTIVERDGTGSVTGVVETRELGIREPVAGERDIGLFLFRTGLVLNALREDLDDRVGMTTGEHGFLYVIRHLAARGLRVQALPIATQLDLVSLNSLQDVDGYL